MDTAIGSAGTPKPASRRAVLRAACRRLDGRTILADRYHEAPLKIAKTFAEEASGGLGLYILDVSPGLMDGDRYEVSIRLDPGTRLFVTNPSFAKVHPSPRLGAGIRQVFSVGRGAALEYVPEPTIPFADSRFASHTRFELDEGAELFYADVLTPGRTRRGERFRYASLSLRTEAYRCGSLAMWDHFRLEPGAHRHTLPGAMEHFTHSGMCWILSDRAGEELLSRIRALLPESTDSLIAGASLAEDRGIAVRMLGTSAWELQRVIDAVWDEGRRFLWRLPPCPFKK